MKLFIYLNVLLFLITCNSEKAVFNFTVEDPVSSKEKKELLTGVWKKTCREEPPCFSESCQVCNDNVAMVNLDIEYETFYVAIDNDNNIYIAGNSTDAFNYNPTQHLFLTKISENGDIIKKNIEIKNVVEETRTDLSTFLMKWCLLKS